MYFIKFLYNWGKVYKGQNKPGFLKIVKVITEISDRYFSVIGFANFKNNVCLRCETVKLSKMQFRAPKDFGPLFGPQLKLNSRKVSQKSFKTVCFRFVNLFIRNWNYSRHKFSNFASAGLFTIWNVRLVHVFQGRQPYCLNFVLVHVQRGVFRWPRPRIHGPDSFISTPVFVSYVCSLRLLIADICTTCLLATSQRIWVKVVKILAVLKTQKWKLTWFHEAQLILI